MSGEPKGSRRTVEGSCSTPSSPSSPSSLAVNRRPSIAGIERTSKYDALTARSAARGFFIASVADACSTAKLMTAVEPANGRKSTVAAARWPGRPAIRSSTRRWNSIRLAGDPYRVVGSISSNTLTWSATNPGLTCASASALRDSSAAVDRTTIAIASCTTTKARRHRGMPTGTDVAPIDRVDPVFLAYAIGSRLIASASATPIAAASAVTVPSSFTSLSRGTFAVV